MLHACNASDGVGQLSSDRPIRPFQVIGFDVLVDNVRSALLPLPPLPLPLFILAVTVLAVTVLVVQDLQTYLIEINANPSLRIDFDLKTPDGLTQVVPSPGEWPCPRLWRALLLFALMPLHSVDEDIKVPAVSDALAVLVQEDLELERRGKVLSELADHACHLCRPCHD